MSTASASQPVAWLPQDPEFVKDWITRIIRRAIALSVQGTPLHPAVKAWEKTIETDPQANMYFTEMFDQLTKEAREELADDKITDYKTLMCVIDCIISEAPAYEAKGDDIVGVPLLLVLNYVMNTAGGMDAFFYDKVNHHLYKVLTAWQDFLGMEESAKVIAKEYTEDGKVKPGWLSDDAIAKFEKRDGKPFEEMYVCKRQQDPVHWGFNSWDQFFTRRLVTNPNDPSDPKTNARPVDTGEDSIISPCETTFLHFIDNVKDTDKFWLKKQPYSLIHMLDHDQKYVDIFHGGTVYQSFLSPFDYHRWHSPVSGTIEKITVIPGTYYAAIPGSADPHDVTKDVLVESQAFLAQVATRVIFYVNTTGYKPDIGLVAFMAIGMAEVSTCHVTVREGQTIGRGDQLGMFHFGGSTCCLVFNNKTEITWRKDILDYNNSPHKEQLEPPRTYINSKIASVKKKDGN